MFELTSYKYVYVRIGGHVSLFRLAVLSLVVKYHDKVKVCKMEVIS